MKNEREIEKRHRVNLRRKCPNCKLWILVSCFKVDTFNSMNRPIRYRFEFILGSKCRNCGKELPYDILNDIHRPIKPIY